MEGSLKTRPSLHIISARSSRWGKAAWSLTTSTLPPVYRHEYLPFNNKYEKPDGASSGQCGQTVAAGWSGSGPRCCQSQRQRSQTEEQRRMSPCFPAVYAPSVPKLEEREGGTAENQTPEQVTQMWRRSSEAPELPPSLTHYYPLLFSTLVMAKNCWVCLTLWARSAGPTTAKTKKIFKKKD